MRAGSFSEAVADLGRVLELEPDHIGANADLAWVLSTAPIAELRDGRRAIDLARKALAAAGDRDPRCLEILAAAHAEVGDFATAIRLAAEAEQYVAAQHRPRFRRQQEQFRQGYPIRQAVAAPAGAAVATRPAGARGEVGQESQ